MSIQGFYTTSSYLNYFHSEASRLNFGAGVFWELYNKKKPNRISFYNELIYKRINPQNLVNDDFAVALGGIKGHLECTKIKLINALRISYPNKSGGRFYYGVGLDNGFRMNTVINGKSKDHEDFSSGPEIGFMACVGETFVFFKSFKVNTELRYEYEYSAAESFSFDNLGLSLQFNIK